IDRVQLLKDQLHEIDRSPYDVAVEAQQARQGFRVIEGGGQEQPQPTPPKSRVEAAQTGLPEVDAVLNSPTTAHVIENAVVDRSHTVPYTAGGSVPLEDPTMYIDHRFPKEFTVPRASENSKIRAEINRYFNGEVDREALSEPTKSLIDKMPAEIKKAGFD